MTKHPIVGTHTGSRYLGIGGEQIIKHIVQLTDGTLVLVDKLRNPSIGAVVRRAKDGSLYTRAKVKHEDRQ